MVLRRAASRIRGQRARKRPGSGGRGLLRLRRVSTVGDAERWVRLIGAATAAIGGLWRLLRAFGIGNPGKKGQGSDGGPPGQGK